VLVAPVTLLPPAGDSVRAAAFVRELVASLERVPGVEAVSAARFVPIPGVRRTVAVERRDVPGPTTSRTVDANEVRPHYFGVTGLPLRRGRDFDEGDVRAPVRVAIVSSAMAERLWPGEDPIGRSLYVDGATSPAEIIGVVGELRTPSASAPDASGNGLLYLPLASFDERSMVLHLRSTGPAAAIAPGVGRALRREGTRVMAPDVLTFERYMERAVLPARVAARVAGVLAGLQLALAIAGLSGVVAYVATLRRREIGIRAALGATRSRMLALVLRVAMRLAAIGGAIGVALSVAVGRVVATTLPVSASIELRAIAVAVVGLALAAGSAMLFPASRALAVSPATTLRVD
jgi:ABC-type antimicrobial peptide transport system permease subunit